MTPEEIGPAIVRGLYRKGAERPTWKEGRTGTEKEDNQAQPAEVQVVKPGEHTGGLVGCEGL